MVWIWIEEITQQSARIEGTKTGQKTTIMAAGDRKGTQQPTVKAERDKKNTNE